MEKKEIKKFGSKESSSKNGEFNCPEGLTVNQKYLYVCDLCNHRVQVLDKENGKFICEWKDGQRKIKDPMSILLHENLFYFGDCYGIQVFTKEGKCIQSFGSPGSGKKECDEVTGICIVDDKLYIVDNPRIQVWN